MAGNDEWYTGLIKQAVVLTNNNTEVAGTQQLLSQATALCFPTKGQIIYYFGPRVERFKFEFKRFGALVTRANGLVK